MKTLSANISAGKDGDSRPVYMIVLKPNSGDTWQRYAWATEAITIMIASGTTGVANGTTVFTDSAATFVSDGVLAGDAIDGDNGAIPFQGTVVSVDSETQLTLSVSVPTGTGYVWQIERDFSGDRLERGQLGTIRQKIDLRRPGGVASVADFDFSVLNQDDFFSTLPDYLENRAVEVRVIFSDYSGVSWSNSLQLGTFLVEDIEFNLNRVRFLCTDASVFRHKDIPENRINSDDFGNVPDESVGKTIPLLFGDFTDIDSNYQSGSNLAKAFMVDRFNGHYIAADHEPYAGGDAYHYDDDLKEFLNFASVSPGTSITGLPSGKTYFTVNGYQVTRVSRPLEVAASNGVTNWENLCDQDLSTFESIGFGLPTTASYKIIDMKAEASSIVRLQVKLLWDGGHSGNGDYVKFHVLVNSSLIYSTPAINTDKNLGEYFLTSEFLASDQTDIEIRCSFVADAGGAENIANVYEMWLDIRSPIDQTPRVVYSSADGVKFGSWIDADGRANGYNQNDLIRNPAYVIESILRDRLGLTSSEVDYSQFDSIGNTTDGLRDSWYIDTQFIERKPSLSYIQEITEIVGLVYFNNYENKESVKEVPLSGSSLKTLSRADYLDGTYTIRKTRMDDVFNSFELLYYLNPASGEYERTVYVNKDNKSAAVSASRQTDCSNSYDNYGFERKLTIKSDLIRDDATAVMVLENYVQWFTTRKKVIAFKTMLNALDLEIGDIITPQHPVLFPSGTAFITSIAHDLSRDEITFEAREI